MSRFSYDRLRRHPWDFAFMDFLFETILCPLPRILYFAGMNIRFMVLFVIEGLINMVSWFFRDWSSQNTNLLTNQLVTEAATKVPKGSIAVITGGTDGIGKAMATSIAKAGYHVIIPARSMGKAAIAVAEIKLKSGNDNVEAYQCNLNSFKSIEAFAEQVKALKRPVHLLVNNAGSYYPNFTAVGEATLEAHFMTNYFSHFYLTALLLGRIKEARGRIINTTSSALYTVYRLYYESIFSSKAFSRFGNYSMTKYAMMIFTVLLSQRLAKDGVTVAAFEPGMVRTAIVRTDLLAILTSWVLSNFLPFLIASPETGALTGVWLALLPEDQASSMNGKLFGDLMERPIPPQLQRDLLSGEAVKLWALSENVTKIAYA